MQTFVKHTGYKRGGQARSAIKGHIKYIENRKNELGEPEHRPIFDRDREQVQRQEFMDKLNDQPEKGVQGHKVVISMKREDMESQGVDMKELTREVMASWEQKTGRQYEWVAVEHDKNSNPHVHVVIAGRDKAGKEVVIMPRQLEQLKRVADKERQRLAERNLERSRVRGLDRGKDLSLDQMLERGRQLEKGLDQTRTKDLSLSYQLQLNRVETDLKRSRSHEQERSRSRGLSLSRGGGMER